MPSDATQSTAVILVIDRLQPGQLGAYGNTWVHTPEIDALAAEAFLFDQAHVDCPHLAAVYRAYWQGLHALVPEVGGASRPTLPGLLHAQGIATLLLTDEPEVADHPLAGQFDELIRLEPSTATTGTGTTAANTVEQTHFARFFATATELLEQIDRPSLVWLHTRGMNAPWDAPAEYRNQYADEDDPRPPSLARVPELTLDEAADPDELMGIVQAYAGQVALLDECIGGLLEAIDQSPLGKQALFSLLSARGMALGEHGRVGPMDRRLYGELVHAAWLMRFPDASGAAARTAALVRPDDLPATLLSWWQLDATSLGGTGTNLMPLVSGHRSGPRDRICMTDGSGERAIRTPGWHLRFEAADPPSAELFVKPDDLWEVNEVSDRCADMVEGLIDAYRQFERANQAGPTDDVPPLEEILLHGPE
ncbi:MAG: sulfatase-like hydrolase/transferase [Planctomycetes bacterium]|nr:sulfatase-like hydrolase/transferase [Planctomycetota bacterium]